MNKLDGTHSFNKTQISGCMRFTYWILNFSFLLVLLAFGNRKHAHIKPNRDRDFYQSLRSHTTFYQKHQHLQYQKKELILINKK